MFDAYDYDVPQHRDRVILIGIKHGEDFALEDFYKNLSFCALEMHKTVRDAIGNMPPLYPLEKVIKDKGRYVSHQCNEKIYITYRDIVVHET